MEWKNLIKNLDFFGFIPSFRINNNDKLKSFIGGLTTLIFIFLSSTYIIYSVINYVNNLDTISTSRTVFQNSNGYNISPVDIYFGIGVYNENQSYLNLTNHPFLEINNEYIYRDQLNQTFNTTSISLQSCDLSSFIPYNDFQLFDTNSQIKINSTLDYYICLNNNSKFYMNPQFFSNGNYFLRFSLNFKKNINMTDALNYLATQNPTISFIFQDYLINSDSKFKPYKGLLGEFTNLIGFYFSKIVDIKINPFKILDDNNPLAQGSYNAIKVPEYSDQQDQSIMIVERAADFMKFFPNRDSINYSNLNLIQFDITLGNLLTSTLRTYRKFNDFVAGVSSIISNIYIIFTILAQKLNKLKGINNMVKASFSLNKSNHVQNLKKKFRILLENFEVKKKNPTKGKKKMLVIVEEGKAHISKEKNANPSEIPFKLSKLNLNENKLKIQEEIKISLMEHIRLKYFCSKKSHDIFFENAIKNVEKLLDINSYLKFKLEMDMIKDIIFDRSQKKSFETVSSILNFEKLFYEENENNSISHVLDEDSDHLYSPLKSLCSRKNKVDIKILKFFKQISEK